MPAHEPARRSGSIVLVLLVAGGIVAAAVTLMTIGRAQAQPYILGLLALLATVELFHCSLLRRVLFASRTAPLTILSSAVSPTTLMMASRSPIPVVMWSISTRPI